MQKKLTNSIVVLYNKYKYIVSLWLIGWVYTTIYCLLNMFQPSTYNSQLLTQVLYSPNTIYLNIILFSPYYSNASYYKSTGIPSRYDRARTKKKLSIYLSFFFVQWIHWHLLLHPRINLYKRIDIKCFIQMVSQFFW